MTLAAGDAAALDLGELEDLAQQYDEAVTLRPLAAVRAWHTETSTSQRRALQALEDLRTVIVAGGNRSGKTFLLRCALVALVLGSDHPDARAFWVANGVDPERFPEGPGEGWIIALTANDSLAYHRRQVLDLLPRLGPAHPSSPDGKPWFAWNMRGQGEAILEIMVPGYDRPARITFKSDKPGAEALQGAACRVILHDEESKLHKEKTWEEADTRLWDQNGWHLMANTPINGRTWVWDRFVRETPDDVAYVEIWSEDNPYTDKTRLQRMKKRAADGDPLALAKLYGAWVVLKGLVYPTFSRARHVIPTFKVPAHWPRFRVIDFGTRHPCVCTWLTVSRESVELADGRVLPDGTVIAYREHYQAEWTLRQHVEVIRRAEGWVQRDGRWVRPEDGECERITLTWVDPEDAQQRLSLMRDHDIACLPAKKSVKDGIDCVADHLSPDDTDFPRFVLMDCCTHGPVEFEGYVWPEKQHGARSERPVDVDDHCLDTYRYGLVGIREWGMYAG